MFWKSIESKFASVTFKSEETRSSSLLTHTSYKQQLSTQLSPVQPLLGDKLQQPDPQQKNLQE